MSTSGPQNRKPAVVPVPGGRGGGARATVGGWRHGHRALSLTDPLVAVTLPVTDFSEAVSSPAVLIVPAVVVQVNAGWVMKTAPN